MAPGGGAYPPGEHNQPRESSCASSQGCPIRVQRAKVNPHQLLSNLSDPRSLRAETNDVHVREFTLS